MHNQGLPPDTVHNQFSDMGHPFERLLSESAAASTATNESSSNATTTETSFGVLDSIMTWEVSILFLGERENSTHMLKHGYIVPTFSLTRPTPP